MLLIVTVLFVRVCGETQFAGLQVGVIDTDLEACKLSLTIHPREENRCD